MSILSRRTLFLLPARTCLAAWATFIFVVDSQTFDKVSAHSPGIAVAFAQKKQRMEEEEDTPKKPPKREVIRAAEKEDAKSKTKTADGTATGDLEQHTTHPGAKLLFLELATPRDHVVFKPLERVTSGSRTIKRKYDVEPIPVFLGKTPKNAGKDITLYPLDKSKKFSPRLASIDHVTSYEEMAQKKVREFLQEDYDAKSRGDKEYLSRLDMLLVAEQALSSVLRWHESARQTGKRSGSQWDAVETALRKQLLDEVLLAQMKVHADAGDWPRVLALTRRLLATYADNKDDRTKIATPMAKMIEDRLKDPTAGEERKQEARILLRSLIAKFPENSVFRDLGGGLRQEAEKLLKQARELANDKSNADNRLRIEELVARVERIWPHLPDLHDFKLQRSSDHPVLRVGVRGRLPKYLSPGWACTDSERRAVELLFESLVQRIPDQTGNFRYRPQLAECRPKVTPLGRRFRLPRNAHWSDGRRLDFSDIGFTVAQLKRGVGLGRPRAWGELLDRVDGTSDAYQMTLRLRQGYLDPLAPMTFKILPNHKKKLVNSAKFAEQPVGSGPFRLDPERHSDNNRQCVVFIANSEYSPRQSKGAAPSIQEVRFYTYEDAVKELEAGKLDLVLDLTAEEAEKLHGRADELHIEIPLPDRMPPNRRIYFLAINQRKLPNAKLRKALAYAIDREKLLNDNFRGGVQLKVHKALNGPFPAGCWACNPTLANRGSSHLHDAGRARLLMSQGATVHGPLSLKYPAGDAVLEKALKELCEQVKSATGIALELAACEPRQLREDVEQTQSYDLAYYHYDFPDETYWLGPLLGPHTAANGDGNIFKFANAPIQQILHEATCYRAFAKVRERQWTLHHLLIDRQMPFIPLWQLDPLLAYRRAVQPAALDPLLVFSNIAEWRLRPH